MNTTRNSIRNLIMATSLLLGASLAGAATTYLWTGANSGNWSDGGNWTNGAAPVSGGTNDVWLEPGVNAPSNQDIDGLYVNLVTFSTNPANFTVSGKAIAVKQFICRAGTFFQTNTVNCDVLLASSVAWGVYKSCLWLNGSVGETNGSQSIAANDPNTTGYIVLAGSNTFSGGLNNSSAGVRFFNDQNLGKVPAGFVSNYIRGGGGRMLVSTGALNRVSIHTNRGADLTGGGTFVAGANAKLIVNTLITGIVPGNNTLNFNGPGEILIGGNNTGINARISTSGLTILMHSNALGVISGSNLTSNAGTVDLNGYDCAYNFPSIWNNTGVDQMGAIKNGNPGRVSTLSGSVGLTYGGGLAFGGAGDIIVTGSIYTNVYLAELRKTGNGTLTLKGANTYPSYTGIHLGGLTLDYTVQNNDKVATNAFLYLSQSSMRLIGNNSAPSVQSTGDLKVGSQAGVPIGAASIRLESGANQNLTLAVKGIVVNTDWNAGCALDVTAVNNGSGVASLTTTNADGLLAGGAATWNQSTWAKISGGTVVGMADGEYLTSFSGGSATTHVDVPAGATTISADTTEQTLRFTQAAGSTVTIASGKKLILPTGAQTNAPGILMTANSGAVSINGPGLLYQGSGKSSYIHQYSSSPLTIAAKLSDTGGTLTKCGQGELILTATNAHWETRLLGGTLTVNNIADGGVNCAIGTGGVFADQDLLIANATLKYIGAAIAHNHRFIMRGPAAVDASGTGLFRFTNGTNITVNAAAGNDNSLTLTGTGSGQMDGALDLHYGSVIKAGSGTWTICGPQPYKGDTIVSNGILRLSNNCVLARSVRVAAGATLVGSATIGEDLVMNGTRRVEIRGDADYDTLNVGFDTTIGGTLEIAEMNGYKMPANMNLSIVTSGGPLSGSFTSVTGGNFRLTTSADGKQILLSKQYPGFILGVR